MMLIHRCKCGHPETFHSQRGECSAGLCDTKCHKAVVGSEPELIPTFRWDEDSQGSVVVEEIGDAGSPTHRMKSHDCGACRQMAGAA